MTTPDNTKWSLIGDAAHVLTMINSLVFAYAVVFHNSSRIFDPLWRPSGFCVMNADVPYFNSHDLCLYADTVGSAVAFFLYRSLKDRPGMSAANDLVKFNIFGIFAHGVGHGGISKALRQGDLVPGRTTDELLAALASAPFPQLAAQCSGLLFFWVCLSKAVMPAGSLKTVLPFAVGSTVMNVFVPPQFGFTFVQTVLLVAFSLGQVLCTAKDKKESPVYALYPLMASFPVCCIGWLESTQCSNFLIKIGGHLVYDAYIPFSMICFYLICYNLSKKEEDNGHRSQGKVKAA